MSEHDEYEYDYDEMENTGASNTIITESFLFKGKKYFSMEKNEFMMMIQRKVEELSNVLELSTNQTFLLLMDYHWNEEKIYSLMSENPSILTTYKEIKYLSNEKLKEVKENTSYTCNVCGISSPDEFEVFGMSCGHVFCKDCYHHHIQIKIDEGEALHLKCMQHDCKMKLLPDICEKLSFIDLYEKYSKEILRNYMHYQTNVRACLDSYCCKFLVRDDMITYLCHISTIQRCKNTVNEHSVECPCTKRICFQCSNEDHYPISCETLGKWNELDKSDGRTMDWLLSNTKRCPKCKMSIEKNQGCRHMKCKSCSHSFCWDCMHPWETNCGYSKSCNGIMLEGYDRVAEEKVKKATLDLQYYMHFFKGFMSQKDAIKFSIALKEKMVLKSHELSEHFGSLQETGEYLIEALNVIIQARNVIKYMYVYIYFQPDNKHLIDSIQGDFMNKTDYLTALTEKPIQELNKTEIVNCSIRLHSELSMIHSYFH